MQDPLRLVLEAEHDVGPERRGKAFHMCLDLSETARQQVRMGPPAVRQTSRPRHLLHRPGADVACVGSSAFGAAGHRFAIGAWRRLQSCGTGARPLRRHCRCDNGASPLREALPWQQRRVGGVGGGGWSTSSEEASTSCPVREVLCGGLDVVTYRKIF